MDSYSNAIILGIVEGLTEFLPVSSTGHLILVGELLGQSGVMSDTFEIFIQFGAILAVLLCYFSRFWGLLFPERNTDGQPRFSGMRGIGLLILTTLPGAVLGLLFHPYIKMLFTPKSVALALATGAVFMLLVEKRKKNVRYENVDELNVKTALGVGFFQCLALWPGFSRSASTIMGGMLLGIKREVAAEYSFIAAVPLITGAAFFDLWTSLDYINLAHIPYFAVGTFVAFLSALVAIKGFIALLAKVGLAPFAWYRLCLAIPVYYFMVN
jgi:undecaprenyl-diphosphatase